MISYFKNLSILRLIIDFLDLKYFYQLKREFRVTPTAVETFNEEKVEYGEIFAW